jgi:hypothetical protein
MSFNYTVGLQNVGSYQVSGQPWLRNYSASSGEIKLFEFPKVTNKITIQNLTGGQDLFVSFAEPRRGVNFKATPTAYYTTDISNLSLSEATISIWVNVETIDTKRFFELIHTSAKSTRMQIHSTGTPEIRFFVNDAAVSTVAAFTFSANDWINITATIKSGESKLFINGQQLGLASTEVFTDTLDTLNLGASTSNFDGIYDSACIFSRVLTSSEIAEIYNSGTFKSPTKTSVSSEIVGLWDFEDNQYKTFYSTPDTLALIRDRSSSSNNLTFGAGGAANVEFVDGQLIENAFDRHKITLSGISEIDLPCKTKQILIKAAGTLELNIKASLTGVPASRMYDLTGPGIDE